VKGSDVGEMEINSIRLRTAINSRTQKTVEAEVNGKISLAPAGAFAAEAEAANFVPDNLTKLQAEIKKEVAGKDLNQQEFDQLLTNIDGTDRFQRLGSVAVALSCAFKKAAGFDYQDKFPLPLSNVMGGGAHGGNTAIQEFLVLPLAAETFPEALATNAAIYQEIKDRYQRRIKGINDEGALISDLDDEQVLKAVKKVADKHSAAVGVDIAATNFWDQEEEVYHYSSQELTPHQQLKFCQQLSSNFDLKYIEDPFHETDYDSFAELTSNSHNTLICGDDLFVTNKQRLERGIKVGAGNSIIIKPNQVGTVSKTLETVELARDNGYSCVVSHRSGTTCDHFIASLALEVGAPVIKAGIAGIRIAKLNKLLREWETKKQPRLNQDILKQFDEDNAS